MEKSKIVGWLIIGVLIIFLLMNFRESIDINLFTKEVECNQSIAFLIFTAIGIIVGTLFK